MAENLRVTKYRNLDQIPNVTVARQWSRSTTGAYCEYNNNPQNSESYGLLYNYHVAIDQRTIAPEGWHIPSESEWNELIDYIESDQVGKLKEAGTRHWSAPNMGATNESGFTAIPGGMRHKGIFKNMGNKGYYWAVTRRKLTADLTTVGTGAIVISNGNGEIQESSVYGGQSIRCVKD
jgi:uncharacterized protein (TIGR02145 family)